MYNKFKRNQQNKETKSPQHQTQQHFTQYNHHQAIDVKDKGNMFKRNNYQNYKSNDQQDKKQFKEDKEIKNNKLSHLHDHYEKPLKYRQKNNYHRSSPQGCSFSSSSDPYNSSTSFDSRSSDNHDFEEFSNSFNQKSNNRFRKISYRNNNQQKPIENSYIKNSHQPNHSQRMFRQVESLRKIKNSKHRHYKDDNYLINKNKRVGEPWQYQQKKQDKRRQESSTNSSHKIMKQCIELVLYGSKYEVHIGTIKSFNRSLFKIFKLISKNEPHLGESKDESKKLQIAIRLIILDKVCSKFESEQDFKDQKLSVKFQQLLKKTVHQYKQYCPINHSS